MLDVPVAQPPRNAGACALLVLAILASPAGAAPPVTEIIAASAYQPTAPYSTDTPQDPTGTIGSIWIQAGDVFDTADGRESGSFYRLMNALHVETKDEVIRRQLLFEAGDTFETRLVEETERILRNNDFLAEVSIEASEHGDGVVDLVVDTKDAWSLAPSVSFSRKGGRNAGGLNIEESNLFGTGSELKFGYKSGIERDERFVAFGDPQLGNTRLSLNAEASDNSDGHVYGFDLDRGFYSLDTRHAFGISFTDFDQRDTFYRLGEEQGFVRQNGNQAELFLGWSRGLNYGWVRRWRSGLGYDAHAFKAVPGLPEPAYLPNDRRDVYPFVSFELLQDRFETTRNTDNLGREEDRHVGGRYELQVGYASESLGSLDDAILLNIRAANGFHPSNDKTLLLEAFLDGRYSSRRPDRFRAGLGARYYHRQSEKRLVVAELSAEKGSQYDTDRLPGLGGEYGLRGYPVGFQTGNARLKFSLEQRVITDWYPFRLFRVGGAAFFDAGQVWGGDPGANLGLLRDVGVGLRIGSPRSSTGKLIHVDIAWPLDGPPGVREPQLVVETRTSF